MRNLAAAAVAAIVMSTSGLGYAEVTTPKVHAHARRNGTVRVTCFRFRGTGSRDLTTIEFERSTDGVSFDPLVTIERPRHYQTYDDLPGAAGVYWYRARVVSDTGTSAWSDPSMVTANAPATPRPTRTPTPAPTSNAPGGTRDPGSGDPPLAAGQRECPAGTITQVLALINQQRHNAGSPALNANAQLAWAARFHSIAMARQQVLTHDGWTDGIHASGYPGGYLAENIAVGYPDAVSVVAGWMSSSGHRTNLLNTVYRATGIGCVVDGNGAVWWTEDFGSS